MRPQDDSVNNQTARSPVKLFTPGQVGLATLFGGPSAGFAAMAINDWSLQDKGRALVWAFVGAGLLTLLDFASSRGWLGSMEMQLVEALAWIPIMILVARRFQGHLPKNNRPASAGAALVLGLLIAGMTIAFYYAVLYQLNRVNEYRLVDNEIVYYWGGVNRGDVDSLVQALQAEGYFDGKTRRSVRYTREDGGLVAAFPLIDGDWDKNTIIDYFSSLRTKVSTQIKAPIIFELDDRNWHSRRRLP